jgi:3-hydroxyacyl-[acyl-carrier-protein] dehydratase
MNYEKTARSFRKKKLYDNNQDSLFEVNYKKDIIEEMIPYRDPFLLIDLIKSVDLKNKTIVGERNINKADPVFKGHFPAYPIYPGVLHVEMIGQLGVCLHHLLANETTSLKPIQRTVDIRLIKIHHVLFQYEILPGDNVEIICQELESDDYTVKGIGQIVKNDQICTVSIAEFYKV